MASDLNKGLGSYGKSLILGEKAAAEGGMGTQKVTEASGHLEIQSGTVSLCLSALLIMFANEKITLKNFTANHSQALVTVGTTELVVMGSSRGYCTGRKVVLKMQWTGNKVLLAPSKTEFKSLLKVCKNLSLGIM